MSDEPCAEPGSWPSLRAGRSVFLWHENNASRGTAEGFIRIQPSSALCMCRDTRRCNRCIRRYGHGYGCPWEAVKRAAGSTLNHADHDKVLSTGEAPVTERAGTYKIGSRAHPQNHPESPGPVRVDHPRLRDFPKRYAPRLVPLRTAPSPRFIASLAAADPLAAHLVIVRHVDDGRIRTRAVVTLTWLLVVQKWYTSSEYHPGRLSEV